MGLVGGDYCDLIAPKNGDGKLTFLLGDVAGKGVAASLLMSHLHAMFRSLAGVGLGLGEMLETANRVFCESTFAGQFATLVCGQGARDGEVEIASAGHLPVLHVRDEGVKQITATGLPLGMFLNAKYEVAAVKLERGDSLLLFTDGISEAQNADGKEYGVPRLSRVLGERHRWTPKDLLGACARDLEKFAAGTRAADDQTLMVVHRGEAETRAIAE
jgi:sigma-B regulation protein RsbU (phosphoserine phosphatase)